VASGVKRISAITGPKVSERMQELQAMLDTTVEKLGIKTHTQLADKLEKTLKEYDEMKSAIESLENKIVHQLLTGKDFASGKDLDKVFKVPADLNFKNVAFQAKALLPEQNILIYTDEGSFVLLTKTGTSAKDMATKLGIKGGGNEATVQGRDEKVLSLFA
jgi:alanyl-tRNA synthetase